MSKKLFNFLLLVLLFCGVLTAKHILKTENIVAGGEQVQGKEQWNHRIAGYVNNQKLNVMIGGKLVAFEDDGAYMNDTLEFMLPLDVFQENFDCAVNVYDNIDVLIEKGNTRIELTVGSMEYKLNGSVLQLQTPVERFHNTIYVPLAVVKTSFGYLSAWDMPNLTVSLERTQTDETEKILPSYYNYSEMDKTQAAKNQGPNGVCWAFAALTALETTLMPETEVDFSEDHLALRPAYEKAQDVGGDYNMALAYLLSWEGPVYEADDPYGDDTRNEEAKAAMHLQEAQVIEPKDFDTIKKMIYQYGGVQSSLYMTMTSANSRSYYYNKENYAYAYIGTEKPNHDIVIVGWDDHYPKENFNIEVGGDGAFICRNSWGSEFGDEGNFYVSYYDTNIGVHNIVYTEVEPNNNYDNIYQSDLCGWTGMMGYHSETAYMANVYTADSDQMLEAVGFYATGMYTEYTIYVVKDYHNTGDLNNRLRVASGSFKNSGYYTVDLDYMVSIAEDSSFAVIVQIKTPGSDMPIAIEYQAQGSNLSIDVSDGLGYISSNGERWENTESERQVNVCLKAYTSNQY